MATASKGKPEASADTLGLDLPSLDDLSLDDKDLFADLDNEIRMDSDKLGDVGALDLGDTSVDAGLKLELDAFDEPKGGAPELDDLKLDDMLDDLAPAPKPAPPKKPPAVAPARPAAAAKPAAPKPAAPKPAAPKPVPAQAKPAQAKPAAEAIDLELAEAGGLGELKLDEEPGEFTAVSAEVDLDRELGELNLGAVGAPDELERALGAKAPAGKDELELALGAPLGGEAEMAPKLDLNLEEEQLNLGALAEAEPALSLDMEFPGPAGAPPAPDVAAVTEMDRAMDELGELKIEPIEAPPEFKFEPEPAVGAAPAAPAAEEPFQAAPDLDLASMDLSLNVPDVAEAAGAPAGAPSAAVAPPAAPEPEPFYAVKNMEIPEEEVLELNLDDLEPPAAAPETVAGAMPSAAAAGAVPAPPEELLEVPLVEAAPLAGRAAAHEAREARAPAVLEADAGAQLLLTIPQSVSIELGTVELNGRDILDLRYGSVVQLNRVVGEPVELVLKGNAIAQGEIVLINGKNLGVRILSVARAATA